MAKYVKQVLIGLNYLHNEGVIHRDIKGANILTTKDGGIKLADFGVAAALTDAESENPVGTPYWMAPEIIELNPATAKSDIWSVGATVIELLTGEPPYFKLDPMPALYRIVQDERPPIPECSKLCEDFLFKCFQKDPEQRSSADKLLKHPWIVTNNNGMAEEEEEKKKKEAEEKEKQKKEAEKKKEDNRLNAEKKLQLLQFKEEEEETDSWGDFGDDEPITIAIGQKSSNNSKKSKRESRRKSTKFQGSKYDKGAKSGNQKRHYDEDEDENFDDMFDNDPFADDDEDRDIDFAKKLQQKMAFNDDDDGDDNAFVLDSIEDDFGDIDFGSSTEVTKNDEEVRQEIRGKDLFSSLSSAQNESEIIEVCTKLVSNNNNVI